MHNKPESKLVIGLMSGTSVDGIDACIVRIEPNFDIEFIAGVVYKYPDFIRDNIFKIFKGNITVEELCWMNFAIGECFAAAALSVIEKAELTADNIDIIGSHGQTVFHKPDDEFIDGFNKKSTLQLGEAAVISERTGITTISDFRTADMAAGGQGAPLVSFADEILFKTDNKNRGILNVGGMSNITVVGPDFESFAFDIGPGNVIIDYCSSKFFSSSYDKDGKLASKGNIDENWLDILLQEPYYSRELPKTTGRELFTPEYIEKALLTAPESSYDIIATATELTAQVIYNAYKTFIYPKVKLDELIIGGGGAYNPVFLNSLENKFKNDMKIYRHRDFNISDKYKEAIAFAILAYACYYEIPNNVPSCTGALHKKILGKVSY